MGRLSWRIVLLVAGILLCSGAAAAGSVQAHIYLLIDEQPGVDGQESAVTQKLRKQLKAYPQLQYQLHYVSWPKALAEVNRRSDALVVGLLRTPAREHQYRWLLPDDTQPTYLYCLQGHPMQQWSISQLAATPTVRIACPALSAHCEMLRQQGFTAQIQEIRLSEQNSIERLLLARRVDFIAVSDADIRRRMNLLEVKPTTYVKGPQLAMLRDYLAGGPQLDPRILAIFRVQP